MVFNLNTYYIIDMVIEAPIAQSVDVLCLRYLHSHLRSRIYILSCEVDDYNI